MRRIPEEIEPHRDYKNNICNISMKIQLLANLSLAFAENFIVY